MEITDEEGETDSNSTFLCIKGLVMDSPPREELQFTVNFLTPELPTRCQRRRLQVFHFSSQFGSRIASLGRFPHISVQKGQINSAVFVTLFE